MPVDITKELKRYIPIFKQAKDQAINEAETSLRIGKFLEDVLGYDVFSEITKEHTVKERYVDYAIKVGGKVAFFIEIKQAGLDLREKHIEQAANYAANAGVSWVALTNGSAWHLYHLTFDDGIQSDLIFAADIFNADVKETASKISLLHKKSILKGEHEDYYARVKVLSPRSIIEAIFHENSLKLIRLNLKKKSGVSVDEDGLVSGIKGMLSEEAWKLIGDVKIKRTRKSIRPLATAPDKTPPIQHVADPPTPTKETP